MRVVLILLAFASTTFGQALTPSQFSRLVQALEAQRAGSSCDAYYATNFLLVTKANERTRAQTALATLKASIQASVVTIDASTAAAKAKAITDAAEVDATTSALP